MFRKTELRRLQSLLDPFLDEPTSHLIAFVGDDDDDEDDDSDDEERDDEEDDGDDDGDEDSGKKTSKKPLSASKRRRGGGRSGDDDDEDDGDDDKQEDDRKSPAYVKARLERDRRARARKAGFDSYEEFEQAAKAHRENTEKNQTETERLSKATKRLERRLAEKDEELKEVKLDLAVTRTLTTDYPDLAGHEEWIMPRLLQEIEDDDWDDERALARIVKNVVKAYADKHELDGGGSSGKNGKRGSDLGTGRTPRHSRGGAPNALKESAKAEGKRLAGQVRTLQWGR